MVTVCVVAVPGAAIFQDAVPPILPPDASVMLRAVPVASNCKFPLMPRAPLAVKLLAIVAVTPATMVSLLKIIAELPAILTVPAERLMSAT